MLIEQTQNLASFAHDLDPKVPEKLAFTINVKSPLERQHVSHSELSNPFTIAIVSPLSRTISSKRDQLVEGANAIRKHINEVRDPAYMADYNCLMAEAPQRQSQVRNAGSRVPVSLLLTSWLDVPFVDLETWKTTKCEGRPITMQPVIGCLPSIPLPERYALDRQVGIIWQREKNNGCWFTANLEQDLWRRILDVSL